MVFKFKINNVISPNFMEGFGMVDFAELNNLCLNDFSNSLKKYLNNGERRYRGRYKPGEVNNKFMEDFSEAFQLNSN